VGVRDLQLCTKEDSENLKESEEEKTKVYW
jgi:hypothetical protein